MRRIARSARVARSARECATEKLLATHVITMAASNVRQPDAKYESELKGRAHAPRAKTQSTTSITKIIVVVESDTATNCAHVRQLADPLFTHVASFPESTVMHAHE